MTTTHELSSHDNDNQPIDVELQARFDSLLRSVAERLETFCTPNKVTFETKKATFGRFGDDSTTISHTITGDDHSGAISFTETEDGRQSFFARNQSKDGCIWVAGDGRRYTGRKVLQTVERNWPISDDTFPRDTIRNLIHPSGDNADNTPDVSAQYIIDLLENYALRNQTGAYEYEMQWLYFDVTSESDDEVRDESATFSLISDGKDTLRQIETGVTINYSIDGIPVLLTCHIHSDEIGNVTVTADYPDPESRQPKPLVIKNHEGILTGLTSILEEMIKEKTLTF